MWGDHAKSGAVNVRTVGAQTNAVLGGDQPLPLEFILPGLRLTPAEIFAALQA